MHTYNISFVSKLKLILLNNFPKMFTYYALDASQYACIMHCYKNIDWVFCYSICDVSSDLIHTFWTFC